MPRVKKTALLLLCLLIGGLLRAPMERPLGREMRTTGLIAEPLDQETSEAIGQTSAAIALGGLRSLVAAVLNFSKIVPLWQDQDWVGIFTVFDQIHTLQPNIPYYWEAAAGYAADDAYADYRDRPGMEEWRRKLRRDEFFHKGIAYLDKGIVNNPTDLGLRQMKARLLSDTYKPDHLDYAAATRVLDEAVKLENVTDITRRNRLYLMSRVPERRREALTLVREIYADPQSRYPSIRSQLFALQNEFPDEEQIPATEIFGSSGDIVQSLFNHYQRRDEGLPMAGVRTRLEQELTELNPPFALHPLYNTDLKRVTHRVAGLLNALPYHLPENPFAPDSSWPLVVNHFQENRRESFPTIRVLFYVLQQLADLPPEDRLPYLQIFPDDLVAMQDLANFLLDESHQYPRTGVRELLQELTIKYDLPEHLDPLRNPSAFPFLSDWRDEVTQLQFERTNQMNMP
ncbi:hypothetical protein [Roseibacillus ishigakijimensis]|uniref:Uncharacterized protein n=1 Tax=Roseibacillus ishigakijimensis TaxID=454146 RepID=A0A934VP05_9BACT|nr:hypothetical protein [Roseibacillus ishigakijimensis]MBK1835606.1 hypothetical protein [Roseibacillus ishigakijimensis]